MSLFVPPFSSPLLSLFASRSNIPLASRINYKLYPDRFTVPDNKINWSFPWKEYKPVYFTHNNVKETDINDKTKLNLDKEDFYRKGFEFDKSIINGTPRNPRGRTGMEGRGLLYKWGANLAVDPIVSRKNKYTGLYEIIAITRKDTGVLAFPGGFLDKGESILNALKREFTEECGNLENRNQAEKFNSISHDLFQSHRAVLVYSGYVDDSRNTDDSWIETVAVSFHSDELDDSFPINAGDDATKVFWLPIESDLFEKSFTVSHKLLALSINSYLKSKI